MWVYGVELILVIKEQGMEGVCDLVFVMFECGEGKLFDQFNNFDNLYVYYIIIGLEIWW